MVKLEPKSAKGPAFERGLERKYEMIQTGRVGGRYPDPRQYLHTDFQAETNNNNIWGFGTAEVDELIETYEDNLDPGARLEAMHRIDEIVHDEAFYIPFWLAPYYRLVHWDYLVFPESYLPRQPDSVIDWMVWWIDPDRRANLERAMAAGELLDLGDRIAL